MAVGVSHVYLANTPRHVGWGPDNLQAPFHAAPVYCVDVLHPDRHPRTVVSRVDAVESNDRRKRSFGSPSLTILAEKNLAHARGCAAKPRRISPVPCSLPSELLEPCEALLDVGDVQDRCQSMRKHSGVPRGSLCL